MKDVGHKIEDEFNKDVGIVAEKTHMKPWMVIAIVIVIVVALIGLIGWCIYRFIKKKRPKGAEDKDKQDDENALVDNEEANAEEVSANIWSSKQKNSLLHCFSVFSNPNSLAISSNFFNLGFRTAIENWLAKLLFGNLIFLVVWEKRNVTI